MTDNKEKDEDILTRVRQLCDDAQDYWQENYKRGEEDRRFVTLDDAQWSDKDREAREIAGIPTLTINKLRTYCKQQINSAKMNKQQIKAEPVDDVADPAVARIFNGLLRDTEISSSADNAYDAAMENVVYSGFGAIRIHVDYVSPDSFQQEPKIMSIHNADSVYFDPNSKELDGSDARYVVLKTWVPKEDIADQYGDDATTDFESDAQSTWSNHDDKTVCVAELFEMQRESKTLYLLVDGTTTFEEPIDKNSIHDQRKSYIEKCWWYKLTGSKVLEDREFVVPMLPIVPVYGDVTWDGEDRYIFSLIHFARDPQKLYNYWKSSEAQQIAEGLRKQFLVPERASRDLTEWANPNAYQALRWNDVDDQGQPIAPPQQLPALTALSGILNAANGAKESIEEILNMQPAAMGQNVNQQSGKAISLLQQRADVSHFHITDNLNKSLAQIGRILIAIYQKVYSVPLIKRITGEDAKTERVKLNEPTDQQGEGIIDGILNNLTIGRYDIRMTTGASYISQRQENKEALVQLLQFVPQIGQAAPDLLLKAFDDGNMLEDIVERIKKSLNPALTQEGEGDPQVQAVLQQYQQQMQQLQMQLQQAMAQVEDQNAERQAKFAIEKLKAETTLAVAQLNNAAKAEIEELKGAISMILQHMQPPEAWVDTGMQDQPPPQQPPNEEPPQEGGFLMPEQMQQQQPFVPDDGQIGIDTHNMAAPQQDPALDGNQGLSE